MPDVVHKLSAGPYGGVSAKHQAAAQPSQRGLVDDWMVVAGANDALLRAGPATRSLVRTTDNRLQHDLLDRRIPGANGGDYVADNLLHVSRRVAIAGHG